MSAAILRSTDARELKTLSGFHVWQREPASHHRVHKPDRLLFWPIRHPQRSSHRAGNAGMQMGRNRRDDPRQRRTIEEETSFLTSNPSVNSGGVDNGKQNGSNVVVRIVTLKSCFLLLPVLSPSPAPNYNAPLSLLPHDTHSSAHPGVDCEPRPLQSRPQCGFGNFPPPL